MFLLKKRSTENTEVSQERPCRNQGSSPAQSPRKVPLRAHTREKGKFDPHRSSTGPLMSLHWASSSTQLELQATEKRNKNARVAVTATHPLPTKSVVCPSIYHMRYNDLAKLYTLARNGQVSNTWYKLGGIHVKNCCIARSFSLSLPSPVPSSLLFTRKPMSIGEAPSSSCDMWAAQSLAKNGSSKCSLILFGTMSCKTILRTASLTVSSSVSAEPPTTRFPASLVSDVAHVSVARDAR